MELGKRVSQKFIVFVIRICSGNSRALIGRVVLVFRDVSTVRYAEDGARFDEKNP